ncbi:MAG: RNA-guided endonuclease TnpB family protein [Nostocaceae cyanobacterium]|nr:RNA-guided endonuclease TnpB family protein [Nostocaceae cyanobacterium]
MLLGFKTQLILNNKQRTLIAKHAGTARDAFNWGLALTKEILDHNKNNLKDKIKFPTAIELHKWLVAIRKVDKPWYYEVSKCAPQYALRQLREAWDRCFKKVSGVPNFKKKGKHDSFTLDGSIKIVDSYKIQVPVIGVVKTYERLPQIDKIKNVTISRQAERWFISFKIETEELTNSNTSVIGVDLGVKSLAVLSTGEVIDGAKSYRQAQDRLAKLQREVSRKVKGSNNRAKSIVKLAKAHARVANIRKDTLHKLTSYLSKNHALVGIEDLNVSGMLANRKLAKAIADMGFYEFRRQLEYKCKIYGSQLIVIDRWFASSKTCSNCGCVKESLSLAERTYHCGECNFSIDRDLNAAINIERYAASSVVSASGWSASEGSS